ncbi:MAG: hypothetical protein ACRDQF_06465 [Thermocrispum sp.]
MIGRDGSEQTCVELAGAEMDGRVGQRPEGPPPSRAPRCIPRRSSTRRRPAWIGQYRQKSYYDEYPDAEPP